jgi:transposase
MLADGSIRSPEVIRFLKHLKRHFRHGVIMLWDRGTIHRSKIVQDFVRQSRKWLDAEFLPPYAPDLNPDEWFWNHLKNRKLANFCPSGIGDLKSAIRHSVIQIRQKPNLVRSFFHASQLSKN